MYLKYNCIGVEYSYYVATIIFILLCCFLKIDLPFHNHFIRRFTPFIISSRIDN